MLFVRSGTSTGLSPTQCVDTSRRMDPASEKQRSAAGRREQRRADLALVTSYHEAQLTKLLERVQEGFRRFEAGEINAFELDDLIHHYKRAARELWKFCGDLSGSRVRSTAQALEELGEDADSIDWWERGNPKRPG
jgi:DNA repair ATPase RecN